MNTYTWYAVKDNKTGKFYNLSTFRRNGPDAIDFHPICLVPYAHMANTISKELAEENVPTTIVEVTITF